MENKKAVVVLAPNGRRQTVKVNPNTTILQILEEVCKKQGFKPEDYDIKHHNKCLDTSTIIRFSGLPNNAQLELAEATKARSEGIVTLGLQLENGTRLTGNFTPSSSVWDVLMQLCPDELSSDNNLVIVYMRQEIYGTASLQDTTLRSLGLTSGRAMLRLIHRSPEELRTQANVSTPLPSRPTEEKPYVRTLKKSDSPPETPFIREQSVASSEELESNKSNEQHDTLSQPKPDENIKKQANFITQFVKQEKRKQGESPTKPTAKRIPAEAMEVVSKEADAAVPLDSEKTVAEEEFVFLGARNAMIFSQETAQAVRSEDLPDDFFELTISDAKKLLRDLKKHRLELENAPLQTSALRNLQKSTQQLSHLNKYKQSIIRVNFPDHTVLQGTFSPVDTVSTVLEFVRTYLEHQQMEFYLYTAPPKTVLDANSRLMEIGCVPNAVLHFGAKVLTKEEKYLRSDLLSKFTTPSVASLAAAKMRQQATRSGQVVHVEEDDNALLEDSGPNDVNVGASTSTGVPQYEDYPSRAPKSSENEKVPKWFKPKK